MTTTNRRRQIAIAAGWAGGAVAGLGAIAGSLYGLVIGETKLARRRIPQATEDPPVSHDTTWAAAGVSATRPPIRLAVLGDSSAAGYGVHRDRDTPAAQLAIAVSAIARRPVHVTNVAVVGAESNQLPRQLDELGTPDLDIALIMIGANDVTHRIKPADAVAHLAEAVTRLRALGAEVIVGTCPDLGTIRPLAQPLRTVARHLSRQMAKAQTVAVVAAGGRTVSLGDLLGPLFASNGELFSDDQFHPSAAGYHAAAEALLPSILDALGMGTRVRAAGAFATRRPRPVERAAAKAATRPGTEVVASDWGTGRPGRRRPLAQLRRRRPRKPVDVSPETARPVRPNTVD